MPAIQVYQPYYGPLNIVAPNNGDFTFGPATLAVAGTPVNLTGYTQKMQLRRAALDLTAVLAFGVTAGTTLVNGGAAGTVTAYASAAAMLLLPPGPYPWDLTVISAGGLTTTWLYGTFTVMPGISR